MTEGVVVGGWGFIWAAYGLTAFVFLVYGVMLIGSVRGERLRAAMEGNESERRDENSDRQ